MAYASQAAQQLQQWGQSPNRTILLDSLLIVQRPNHHSVHAKHLVLNRPQSCSIQSSGRGSDRQRVDAAQLKSIYDKDGEEALKYGKPDGHGGVRGGGYSFGKEQSMKTFSDFFGTENPYEALEGATPS